MYIVKSSFPSAASNEGLSFECIAKTGDYDRRLFSQARLNDHFQDHAYELELAYRASIIPMRRYFLHKSE